MKGIAIFFLLPFLLPSFLFSSNEPAPIIFIVDASGSMWGQIEGDTKMHIAKKVLNELVDSMQQEQPLGLVAYGHRQKSDCEDVEYLVPADSRDKKLFQEQLQGLKPLGRTPLAYSARLVIDRLRESGEPATIILLTDGIETCKGDLCQLVRDAKAEGITFKMHIVGFDLKPEEKEALQCAAEAGEGNYLDASNAEELSDVLVNTTSQTVDAAPPNVFLTATKNGQLIDAYVKVFDQSTGEQTANGYRSYSDTAKFFLPPGNYEFEVSILGAKHGIALSKQLVEVPEAKDSIKVVSVSFDAGSVVMEVLNNGEYWDATIHITRPNERKSLTQGRSYDRAVSFELEGGNYDVTIKPLHIKGLEIQQSQNFSVHPNQSDTVRFQIETGEVYIGARANGELIDAVVHIHSLDPVKNIASGRTYVSDSSNPKQFIVLSGDYKVIVKPIRKEFKGVQKDFTISVLPNHTVRKMMEF